MVRIDHSEKARSFVFANLSYVHGDVLIHTPAVELGLPGQIREHGSSTGSGSLAPERVLWRCVTIQIYIGSFNRRANTSIFQNNAEARSVHK
jgi:hypothetical protein